MFTIYYDVIFANKYIQNNQNFYPKCILMYSTPSDFERDVMLLKLFY